MNPSNSHDNNIVDRGIVSRDANAVSYSYQSHMQTYLIKTTNLACTISKHLATIQAFMIFVLKRLEIDHTLDDLSVVVDETPDQACECIHHLWCGPHISGIGNLGFDGLEGE
jgi:hypothetical protein